MTTELPDTDIRQALADDLQRMGMWPEVDDETEAEPARSLPVTDRRVSRPELLPRSA